MLNKEIAAVSSVPSLQFGLEERKCECVCQASADPTVGSRRSCHICAVDPKVLEDTKTLRNFCPNIS